jgi:hypothetical protein
MPQERYEAGRQTLGSLLSTTSPTIRVPEWQRSYSWDTAQVETFWQDLIAFSNRYPGDNINGQEYFLGSIVLVTGGLNQLLLDGQQRLATTTILLSALRDARRLHNQDSATRLHNKYIADFDDASGQMTFQLTLNRYDWEFYRGEIQTYPVDGAARPTPSLKSHALIRRALHYFEQQVADGRAAQPDNEQAYQWVLRISRVLLDHMSVVAVTSTDEDNAAAVFETLNDRGIGLSTPDLLRNLLLRRATNEDERDRIVAAWSTILSIEDEASVDDFLRHYWVSTHGDVKSRKLYRAIKDEIEAENTDSLTFSLDLAETAPLYRDLLLARDEDPELQRLLEAIRMLGGKPLYPALLSGYARAGENTQPLREFAAALITMFVRSSVIVGREAGAIETNVYTVAKDLRDSGDFAAAIAALQGFAPGAEDFVERFRRASVSRRATARYLLREIEHAKRVTQELAVEGTDRVHVEHIYPQDPQGERWPNHTALINRLGNLTLLARRLNTAIKNADFITKKAQAYNDSDILLTRELLAYDDWSPETVNQRQDELAGWAFGIWHFPGEEPPPAPAGGAEAAEADEALAVELPEVPTG